MEEIDLIKLAETLRREKWHRQHPYPESEIAADEIPLSPVKYPTVFAVKCFHDLHHCWPEEDEIVYYICHGVWPNAEELAFHNRHSRWPMDIEVNHFLAYGKWPD